MNVPPYVRTMRQRMEIPLWPSRTAAGFPTVCGTLALVLASVGLFGVTYYAVAQRTRASHMLTGISPADPLTYATAASLQAIVALAACALPAYRATMADPMSALRQE